MSEIDAPSFFEGNQQQQVQQVLVEQQQQQQVETRTEVQVEQDVAALLKTYFERRRELYGF